jgi:hypothetical protein
MLSDVGTEVGGGGKNLAFFVADARVGKDELMYSMEKKTLEILDSTTVNSGASATSKVQGINNDHVGESTIITEEAGSGETTFAEMCVVHTRTLINSYTHCIIIIILVHGIDSRHR